MADPPIKIDVDLTKPATVFIEKVAGAIGVAYEPTRIKKKAKAEAEAKVILAKANANVTAIEQRAANRLIHEEVRNQQNMEAIIGKALPEVESTSNPANMDDDWIAHFFHQSRQTSDSQMQDIWAHILAGEANSPGSYSKRTINLLAELDRRDAELFSKLTNFAWNIIGRTEPLIFDPSNTIYTQNGINFGDLKHLESLGLISLDLSSGYALTNQGMGGQFVLFYIDHSYVVKIPEGQDNQLSIGKVIFTSTGRDLLAMSPPEPVEGLEDYIKEQYAALDKKLTRL